MTLRFIEASTIEQRSMELMGKMFGNEKQPREVTNIICKQINIEEVCSVLRVTERKAIGDTSVGF